MSCVCSNDQYVIFCVLCGRHDKPPSRTRGLNTNTVKPEEADRRGRTAEERVLRILREPGLPEWCVGPHDPATADEDAAGIDIVARLDIGPVFIQVKASKKTAKNKRGRYLRRGIIVVWAGQGHTDQAIRERLLASLVEMREARRLTGSSCTSQD